MEEKNEDAIQDKVQDAKDTAQTAKDGASFAKNIAKRNYLGAVKDGIKLLKNEKVRTRLVISSVMGMLGPILTLVIVAVLLFGIFNVIGEAISTAVNAIVDFFTVDSEGVINIDDTQVDTIINTIVGSNVSMDGLKLLGDVDYTNPDVQRRNLEAQRKYIRKFFEAQAMTQTINTNPSLLEQGGNVIFNGNKPYGRVMVYRVDENNNKKQLTYISYDEMKKKQENGNKNIKDNFSIDESGKLVISSMTETKEGRDTEVNIQLRSINYKNTIAKYTTPMNFLIYLTMVTQNPEFTSAVVDLVKDSRIDITVMDNIEETIIKEVRTYTKNTANVIDVNNGSSSTPNYQVDNSSKNTETIKEESTRTITTTTPVPQITYVKTWFCEQTIDYSFSSQPKTPTSNSTDPVNESMPTPRNEGVITWKTNDITTTTISGETSKFEQTSVGDVVDKTDDFITLLDTEYKIPNSSRREAAGSNLVSGAEWLFALLQQDAELQNLEQIMRYILQKYDNGRDYGATEFNFEELFDISGFELMGDIVIGNTVEEKVWYTLRNVGFSEYSVAGAMGNIYAESGFNPDLIEKGSGVGYGLCQWSWERRTAYEKYAESKGVAYGDVNTQLEFLIAELTGGNPSMGANNELYTRTGKDGVTYSGQMWKNATSVEEAAKAFCYSFERPRDPNIEKRVNKALEYYNMFAGRLYLGGITGIASDGTDTFTSSKGRMYYVYKQGDSRWANSRAGTHRETGKPGTMKARGCLATSIATVLTGYGIGVNPGDLAYTGGISVSNTCRKYAGDKLVVKEIDNPSKDKVITWLESGGAIIVRETSGYWTSSQHHMPLLDLRVVNGVVQVYVGNTTNRNTGWFNIEKVLSTCSNAYFIGDKTN